MSESGEVQAPNNNNSFYAVALVFLLLLAVISGFYLGRQEKQPSASPTPQPIISPSPIVAISLSPEATATPSTSPKTPIYGQTYINKDYGFKIALPANWQTRQENQGELKSTYIYGKTQKEQTEFYDGAAITILLPVKMDKDVATWMREKYGEKSEATDEPNIYGTEKIGNFTWQTVRICGLGCMEYYHLKSGDYIYGISIFAGGPDEEKYRQQINESLASWEFSQ